MLGPADTQTCTGSATRDFCGIFSFATKKKCDSRARVLYFSLIAKMKHSVFVRAGFFFLFFAGVYPIVSPFQNKKDCKKQDVSGLNRPSGSSF